MIATKGGPHDQVHAAVRQARLVVGLYGDPVVSWSVVLRLGLVEPASTAAVEAQVQALCEAYPHLGPAGQVRPVAEAERESVLRTFADQHYGDRDPLLRVGLARSGHELLLAAHHGAMDGLGLLGAASALTGLSLASTARGVSSGAEPSYFLRMSAARLLEAAFRPPLRLAASGGSAESGDLLAARDVRVTATSTSALVLTAARVVRRWNATRSASRRRLVVAMGLSRRPGEPPPPPDRDTAYARLPVGDLTSLQAARDLVVSTVPEPAFPVSEGLGLAPLVTRLLSSRLGSTVLVSNLGRVEHPGLARLEFWPVPTGPAGICLGLASTRVATTVTTRVRHRWFDEAACQTLADLAVAELARAGGDSQ